MPITVYPNEKIQMHCNTRTKPSSCRCDQATNAAKSRPNTLHPQYNLSTLRATELELLALILPRPPAPPPPRLLIGVK